MDLDTTVALVKILGSTGAAVAGISAFIRWIIKPIKSHFLKIDKIVGELTPNGGGSIKDAVTKIEVSVAKIESWQKTRLNLEAAMFFDTDKEGAITWANKETVRQLKATEADLNGFGYRNFICAQDRVRVVKEIEEATRAEIDLKTHFTAVDGRCFSCEFLVVRFNKTVAGYTGVLIERGAEACPK